MKQKVIRPGDIVVLTALAVDGNAGIVRTAIGSGRSVGEAHGAIRRLKAAGLLDEESGRPFVDVVLPFLEWGVPFAYPAEITAPSLGVPTGLLEPPKTEGEDQTAYVWASPLGSAVRDSVVPLHPRVPEIALASPRLWKALSLIDLLRLGGPDDRRAATAALRPLFTPTATRHE